MSARAGAPDASGFIPSGDINGVAAIQLRAGEVDISGKSDGEGAAISILSETDQSHAVGAHQPGDICPADEWIAGGTTTTRSAMPRHFGRVDADKADAL